MMSDDIFCFLSPGDKNISKSLAIIKDQAQLPST